MLNYIHEYEIPESHEFNEDFITAKDDIPLEELVSMVMHDFERVENIEILAEEVVPDQDDVDYNRHIININYKKKHLDQIEIPRNKFVADTRFSEMVFTIRIHTNLNEATIVKRILLPVIDDGVCIINSKTWKPIWQLCDANTYTQRGKVTLKSRMPIIIYQTKNRIIPDTTGREWNLISHSYALDTKPKRRGAKKKTKFINPMMIFAAKMGMRAAIRFFNMDGIIDLCPDVDEDLLELYTYFKMDGLGYGLAVGRRHDPDATPVSAFRLALKAIRDAVPDATLLGCCPPFMPSLGLVDNCRVSGDTSRYYQSPGPAFANFDSDNGCSIRNAMHVTMANWWKFDRWFRCDPDTLMARQDNAFYTYGEAKMSVLTGIITGVCITSDNLGTIAPDRLALLGRAQNLRLRDAKPFEWPKNYWPQVFEGTVDGRKAVAIFNDCDHEMAYEFEKYGLPEECDELLDVPSVRKKKIILPAHDAALIVAR